MISRISIWPSICIANYLFISKLSASVLLGAVKILLPEAPFLALSFVLTLTFRRIVAKMELPKLTLLLGLDCLINGDSFTLESYMFSFAGAAELLRIDLN